MATNIYPFGEPDEVKKVDDSNDTPQQKKFETKTGKDSDSAVGDTSEGKTSETTKKNSTDDGSKSDRPKGVSQESWDQAEQVALGKLGGFSGVSPERKKELIQEVLDQQSESIKQTEQWEGK